MEKVRSVKDMPFCEAGEEFPINHSGGVRFHNGFYISSEAIEDWISSGWLEWVTKEKRIASHKRLDEKFDIDCSTQYICNRERLAQIAKEHFNMYPEDLNI